MKKRLLYFVLTIMSIQNYPYVKSHVNSIKERAAQKEIVNAANVDCRGADLSGIYLVDSQLSGANFGFAKKKSKTSGVISIPGQKTDLSNANLSGSICVSTNFAKANLQKANLSGARLRNADFSGADLTGASLDNVIECEYAVFCGTTMPDGKKLTSKTWKSKSGQVFYAHCPKKK